MRKSIMALLAAASLIAGMSVAHADPKPNVIAGTLGDDVLLGTIHADVIVGLSGNDVLYGNRGNDVLVGGPGADRLRDWFGHSGSDVFFGGRGPKVDRCVGDASDVFHGCEIIVIR